MNCRRIFTVVVPGLLLLLTLPGRADDIRDWHLTALHSSVPNDEVLHLSISGNGKPDVIERWWNGKRVRWLDESGRMQPDDARGDQVGSVMQVDMDGDGIYDGPNDMNVKWCDTDGDGVPDVQAITINPATWGAEKSDRTGNPVFMVFINHDQHGVLGWIDWKHFDLACWAFTGTCNWLPNYHGNNDFVKTHCASYALTDPRLNWENPFSFYDEEGKGVANMAMRWCAPQPFNGTNVDIRPVVNAGFVTYDLDGNAGKDNESSFDMTLAGSGASIDISSMSHPLPHFAGNPKFDPCFQHNEWRRIKELIYMDRNKGYSLFFKTHWKCFNFVFDEDGDDHRWERVELLSPTSIPGNPKAAPVDIYSTARFGNTNGLPPGLDGNGQSDSLGDRGEFDLDGSGGGKLYIGVFDRKFHLYGAKWGAWTVDEDGKYHGGGGEPTHRPPATKINEVVKYTDTDGDGFIDTIEYDYDGDRKVDFKVCLLDYEEKGRKSPDVASLIDPGKLGWKGLHELFNKTAQASWLEALEVYHAAWQRDLTSPELDKLAAASSLRQRYDNSYWIKEKIFRMIRERLQTRVTKQLSDRMETEKFLADYARVYYTGHFDEVVRLIGKVPSEPWPQAFSPVVIQTTKKTKHDPMSAPLIPAIFSSREVQ
ncbi:MAG TPA: hypothetical protein VK742_07285 [Candidatus Sulfotelmatobacter sp.]|nr:hypothetical protein [Candidatus Sulfotelmatobacter sp.]